MKEQTENNKVIEKPGGYVNHRIVYDPMPKLIIDLDYTAFQQQMILGKDYQEFEVEDIGDGLLIREI